MRRAVSATLSVAALLAVPATASADSVIVKYRDGAVDQVARPPPPKRAGVSEASSARSRPTVLRSCRSSGDAAAAAATLSRSSTVEYAEPNVELRAFATPNDPRFGELYGLHNANDADMDAPEGWDAAGLGALPGDRRGQGRDRRHGHRRERTRTSSGKVVDCARVAGCSRTRVPSRAAAPTSTTTARTWPARSRRRPTTASASPASRSTRNLAICKRAQRRSAPAPTAGVANCITYLAQQGRQGDLDVARRRRLHDAAERRPHACEQRQRRAARRRGRQRRQRDASTTRPATPRS